MEIGDSAQSPVSRKKIMFNLKPMVDGHLEFSAPRSETAYKRL